MELVRGAGETMPTACRSMTRRLAGEPLAWITGTAPFVASSVRVHPGVYVPRWQSSSWRRARRPASRIRARPLDLCTGSGAIAAGARGGAADGADRGDRHATRAQWPAPGPTASRRSRATSVVRCRRAPRGTRRRRRRRALRPDRRARLLPRDTLRFEDVAHYDGGPDGTDLLRRVVTEAPASSAAGGALLLELGRRPGRSSSTRC